MFFDLTAGFDCAETVLNRRASETVYTNHKRAQAADVYRTANPLQTRRV
jgi:hypothetical protein